MAEITKEDMEKLLTAQANRVLNLELSMLATERELAEAQAAKE